MVSIIEIPVADMQRAKAFYQALLGIRIEEADMGGTRMGVFPADTGAVNVALVQGDGYAPSTGHGAVIYFDAGADLQPTLDRAGPNGGKVIVPKTEISPEMGFFAMFTDTEGNRVGLHSVG